MNTFCVTISEPGSRYAVFGTWDEVMAKLADLDQSRVTAVDIGKVVTRNS